MSQDLLISLIEIERGKDPDWSMAHKHIDKMNGTKLRKIHGSISCPEDKVRLSECLSVVASRRLAHEAIHLMEMGWAGNCSFVQQISGAGTDLLIAGGTSWGDPVEECDQMFFFVDSGAAEAAGFLVGGNLTRFRRTMNRKEAKRGVAKKG